MLASVESGMDYHSVYRSNAEQYQRLVAAEDADNNLGAALADLLDTDNTSVIEIGAGTGRVTRILAAAGATVTATEPAPAMLQVAARLGEDDPRTTFCQAEAAALPFPSASFDAAIAGWVFAHQREWSPDNWRDVVAGFVSEAARLVTPGGPIVLIETLGTGYEEPNPPADLVEYYAWLESELGFTRTTIRTDYQFQSVAEAAEVTGSFFGPAFADVVNKQQWSRVPECTGIWTRIG